MEKSKEPSFAKASEGKENIIVSGTRESFAPQKTLASQWFFWHFYEMPKFLFLVWKNYLSFGLNYFSVPLLLLTLFSPWKKYRWRYPKGFDIGEYFSTFVSNIFSRIIGAICRFSLIIIGIVAQIFIFTLGMVVILFWFLIPVILVVLILLLLYAL